MKPIHGRNLIFKREIDNGNILIVTPRGEQVEHTHQRKGRPEKARTSKPKELMKEASQ
jgi:hypothetical protein